MDREEYYRFHLIYYFLISAIGGVFIYFGKTIPVYNEQTGEIINPYTLPFIILGAMLIVISFIGMIFFNDIKEGDGK